jgi:hypothetical protein
LNQPVTLSRATTVVVVVGDIAVDDFAADARKPGPRRGAQRNHICAPQPVIAEESPAVQNGGSRASSVAGGSSRLATMVRVGASIAVLADCIPSPEGIPAPAAATRS